MQQHMLLFPQVAAHDQPGEVWQRAGLLHGAVPLAGVIGNNSSALALGNAVGMR